MSNKKIKEQLVNTFDLPQDVVYNSARITVVGGNQVTVENHRGIIEYTAESIRVNTLDGEVCVLGKDLIIKDISPELIIVIGSILEIKMVN